MCYNCGCQNPNDDMGDHDNITEHTLSHLSSSKLEVLKMLEEGKPTAEVETMIETAAKSWGQSVDEAKKNTITLLKKTLNVN